MVEVFGLKLILMMFGNLDVVIVVSIDKVLSFIGFLLA